MDSTTRSRPSSRDGAAPAAPVLADSGPQVGDDMTVDLALSVLIGASVEHLLIRDEDGRCSGRVTRAQLNARRNGPWYREETRLRDIVR